MLPTFKFFIHILRSSSARTSAEPLPKESTSKSTRDSSKSANDAKKLQLDVKNNNDSIGHQSGRSSIKKEVDKSEDAKTRISSRKSKAEETDLRVGSAGHNASQAINFDEDTYPIENEEWIVFLQKTIEEVMGGEMTSLSQPNLANIVVSPLRNCNCSSKVVAFAASLMSLPFVINKTPEECLETIKKVGNCSQW